MDEIKKAIAAAIKGKDITRISADSLYHFLQPKCEIEPFRQAFQEVIQPPKKTEPTPA